MSALEATAAQQAAIQTQGRALMVEAGAGTGKTWVLVQRFLHLLETHPTWPLESLVAITFTEKAAREMRTRLRQAIEAKAAAAPADKRWATRRRTLDNLQVSTIHGFCARVLRENALAAGLDPYFQVLDEEQAALLKEEALRTTLQDMAEKQHLALALLTTLRVWDVAGEMAAMLEKRGTLTRLFEMLEDPAALLDKWRHGVAEMQAQIWRMETAKNPDLADIMDEVLGVEIRDPADKLSPAVQLAQQGVGAVRRGALAEACAAWAQIRRVGGKGTNWGGTAQKKHLSQELLAPLQALGKALGEIFAYEVGSQDEQAAENLQQWRALWKLLEAQYNVLKEATQALDFDDLELRTVALLRQTPRPARLQAFLASVQHVMVDEYQDTNLIQQALVEQLAPVEAPGKLFVVGDAKQSIYRFRQAQVSLFNQTAQAIRTATGAPPVTLATSFRAHTALVAAQNHLFAHLLRPLDEQTHAVYEAPPGPLQAQRASAPSQTKPVEICLLPKKDAEGKTMAAANTRVLEARWLAQRLLALQAAAVPVWDKDLRAYRPFEFRDAAILFRATTQLPLYEAEFKAAGLPYLTLSGRGYYDRPEVQDVLALLAALANPADDLNLATALRSPLFGLSDETLLRLRWWQAEEEKVSATARPYAAALVAPPATAQPDQVAHAGAVWTSLRALVGRVTVWELLHTLLESSGYESALAHMDGETGRSRTNVQKLLALARERSDVSLTIFLAQLRDLRAREAREGEAQGREPESGAVRLMSIHASKGLEFPVVAVADLGRAARGGFGTPYLLHDPEYGVACKVRDEGGEWQAPASYAWAKWKHDLMETAESKRLLYVAATRAADYLQFTGKPGGETTWLAEILAAFELEEEGAVQEVLSFSGFSLQVWRPQTVASPAVPSEGPVSGPEIWLEELPPLTRPLPPARTRRQLAVTRLDELLAQEEVSPHRWTPALWQEERRATPRRRAPGYKLGNLVHRALAQWQSLLEPPQAQQTFLRSLARREGIFPAAEAHAVELAARMLAQVRASPLFAVLQRAPQRHHETPFTLQTPVGTVHGVLDLLYQTQAGGWHLVDWKTEWAPQETLAESAAAHHLQMAVYAQAVQDILGVQPSVSLCFLHPSLALVPLSRKELQAAWASLAQKG